MSGLTDPLHGRIVPTTDGLERFVRTVVLPPLAVVRQTHTTPALADVEEATRGAMSRVLSASGRSPGPVAVAVGSRGMADLVAVVKTVVAALRGAGWAPFVVPGMGSHGGGSEQGQAKVLAGLGVTEESVGAPVRSVSEVDDLGRTHGLRIFVDRAAAEAGAVLVVNRVKVHTDFHGAVESGPAKMLAVGLSHTPGAAELHADGPDGLRTGIVTAARFLADTGLVLGAVATVENEIGQTAIVQGLLPDEIGGESEQRLLRRAKAIMPRLPFDELDVLIVQRLGKDISGEGVDPNVIGRMYVTGVPEPERPAIRSIVALSLTEGSAGNALGVGLTDVISRRLANAIDFGAMYVNALTAGIVDIRRAKLPIVLPTDRLAIKAGLATCGRRDLSQARVMWIRDTEHLELVGVSEALAREAAERDDLSQVREASEMRFDDADRLVPLVAS